jgi:glycogen debranching enzyme
MRLLTGLYQICRHVDLRRLPELICGIRRVPGNGPTLYPVACVPQAWSSAAPLALLQACLGLEFDFEDQGVRFLRPGLSDFVDEITIRSLAVGDGKVDVVLRRHSTDLSVNVLRRQGRAQVTVRH